ncbi:MAG: hypothetical protein ACFE96_02720 [Candidatus Hermodarchaeota archaeon]
MMKLIKNKNIILLVLLVVIMVPGTTPLIISELNNGNKDNPKLSDPDIIINSPENTVYTIPMEGYYPGTYGFEDEEDSTSGVELKFLDHNTYPACEVVSSMDGHNKVLKLTSDANWRSIYDMVNDKSEGTVEWWVRTPISYVSHRLILYDGATQGIIIYFHNDGNIYEHDGSAAAFTTYEADTWTHVRVDFECLDEGEGNGYQKLQHDTYYVYINGEKFGPFEFKNGVSAIDKVFFDTGGASNTRYIDAVSYSWDISYDPGDNRYEGLLLEFEPESYSSMSYSLDGGIDITISGDTVIPWPDSGLHNIVVIGDSETSEPRYFTIDNQIDIISPLDITYTESLINGYYPATYGFEAEPHTQTGTDIDFLDDYFGDNPQYESYYDIRVLDGPYNEHNKILHVRDSQGGLKTWGVHQFDNPPVSGTIDFWLYMNDGGSGGSTYRRQEIHFRKANNDIAFRARLRLMTAKVEFWDGSNWEEFADCEDETWYHHSITFDCEAGKYKWRIKAADGTPVGMISDISFENEMTSLDELFITTLTADYKGHTKWDAFGFSWEENYYVGENEREGIIISYDSNISLDQVFYKLDNDPLLDFSKQAVLSVYNGGDHSLRLIGKDSGGSTYYSDIVQYSCEPDGWHSKTLVGAKTEEIEGQFYDRRFPYNDPGRLGFEIQTTGAFMQNPIISFKIAKTYQTLTAQYVRAYIDNQMVLEELVGLDFEPFEVEIEVEGLRTRIGHQIFIEVEDLTSYHWNTKCKLEYLRISRLEFWDLSDPPYDDKMDIYTPFQSWYNGDNDGAFLSIQTHHQSPYTNGKLSASPAFFSTAVTVLNNPDRDYIHENNEYYVYHDYYYIHSVTLQLRVVRPNGHYLDFPNPVQLGFHLCKQAYDYQSDSKDEMDMTLIFINLAVFVIDVYDLLEWVDEIWQIYNMLIDLFGLLETKGSGEPGVYEAPGESHAYQGWWETGYTQPLEPFTYGLEPNPFLNDFSMVLDWHTEEFFDEEFGPYQIEMTYLVDFWLFTDRQGQPAHRHTLFVEPAFTETYTSYVNFIYY